MVLEQGEGGLSNSILFAILRLKTFLTIFDFAYTAHHNIATLLPQAFM